MLSAASRSSYVMVKRLLGSIVRKVLVRSALAEARIRYLLGGIRAVAAMIPKLSQQQLVPILRQYGAMVGNDCDLCVGLFIHNPRHDFANLSVGVKVHVGPGTFLDLTDAIKIGHSATISMRCVILTHMDVGASPV